jgi:hypothetical protein
MTAVAAVSQVDDREAWTRCYSRGLFSVLHSTCATDNTAATMQASLHASPDLGATVPQCYLCHSAAVLCVNSRTKLADFVLYVCDLYPRHGAWGAAPPCSHSLLPVVHGMACRRAAACHTDLMKGKVASLDALGSLMKVARMLRSRRCCATRQRYQLGF